MKINYVVPRIEEKISGGQLCIYEYINGLTDKGHEVTVVPLKFYDNPYDIMIKGKVIAGDKSKINECKSFLKRNLSKPMIDVLRIISHPIKRKPANFISQRFERLGKVIQLIPDCDINIATSFETALAVYFSGKGIPFYFMQHFEELFNIEYPDPEFSKRDAALSYLLPLHKIANSSWLKRELETCYPDVKVIDVVNNAIRHEIFYPRPSQKNTSNIRIISYGGRYAPWKGFSDAANAIRIARRLYPDIEWLVYGGSLLPPDNEIAPYSDMGYLSGDKLAEFYSSGDIMLCTAWYESFPLYPLEGMACGLAVITTDKGTEDYAINGVNCITIPPKQPEDAAKAIIKLIEEENIRKKLTDNGTNTAREFTWTRSINKLEKLFSDYYQRNTHGK
jgi:glycosyltransferase involved in cell wall biosynthesis